MLCMSERQKSRDPSKQHNNLLQHLHWKHDEVVEHLRSNTLVCLLHFTTQGEEQLCRSHTRSKRTHPQDLLVLLQQPPALPHVRNVLLEPLRHKQRKRHHKHYNDERDDQRMPRDRNDRLQLCETTNPSAPNSQPLTHAPHFTLAPARSSPSARSWV